MGGDRHKIASKIALLIVVAACLVSAGYFGGTGTPPDEAGRVAEPLIGTAWHLTSYRADNGSVAAPLPGKEPSIIFGDSGTLSGSAGCNLYSASYRVGGSGIRVDPIAVTAAHPATEDGLMQQESRYRELLVAAASYRVEGDRLVFFGPSGRDLLTFVRDEQPPGVPLLETEWRLAHYSTGGSTVASPAPGTGINLTFDPDGTLSGSAGCNAYSAPYTVNETGIAVERIVATKASATEPAGVMEQETAYLALLRATGSSATTSWSSTAAAGGSSSSKRRSDRELHRNPTGGSPWHAGGGLRTFDAHTPAVPTVAFRSLTASQTLFLWNVASRTSGAPTPLRRSVVLRT